MNSIHRFALAAVVAVAWAPPIAAAQPGVTPPSSGCELHVYPTRYFRGSQRGALSGLGMLGGVIDADNNRDSVDFITDMMAKFLTPAAQMAQLRKANLLQALNLPADTRVTVEAPLPNHEDIKVDPAAKARHDAMTAREKAGRRLTEATAACYGELVVRNVFYQKATFYGTRIFAFFTYRHFRDGASAPRVSSGQVENPAPDFPFKGSGGSGEEARDALLRAYAADFEKWVSLKYQRD